jgi:hypothetical protein
MSDHELETSVQTIYNQLKKKRQEEVDEIVRNHWLVQEHFLETENNQKIIF